MNLEISSPDLSNENLKCTNCGNYLSYLPIYLTTSGNNICGRCPSVISTNKKKCVRNVAFEVLCQSVHFPCRFKDEGCEEKMLPRDIADHEGVCRYKRVKCPNFHVSSCDWEGAFPNIMEHCLDEHFDSFLPENGAFTVDLTKSHQTEHYLKYGQILYVFSKKFDSSTNILQCAIYHIEDEVNMANYSCTLSLKNSKRVLSDECITTAYDEKQYITVNLDCLKTEGTSSISATVTFDEFVEDESHAQERINEQLLSQLQCTKCWFYALPPIYHDKDSNVYCFECKNKSHFRNYNLDNIANMLNYPCENKDKGCTVVLKPAQMKPHQKMCLQREYDCPLLEYEDCLWKGTRKDMVAHIQQNHKEKIIVNGSRILVHIDHSTGLTECYYLVHYSNHLFKLVISTRRWNSGDEDCESYEDEEDDWSDEDDQAEEQYFRCTVQKVGYFEGDFKYEIEVTGDNDNWRKFSGRQLCSHLTDQEELFSEKKSYCYFTSNQLEGLVENKKLINVKVRIFQ